jgi:hypothetical protein
MITTLIVCLTITGWPSPDKMAEFRRLRNDALIRRAVQSTLGKGEFRPFAQQVAGLPQIDHAAFLQTCRRGTAILESHIQWLEKRLERKPGWLPP